MGKRNERTAGVVYIMVNPSFPDYVKLGYASDLEERVRTLNASECVPYAFRPYAWYETPKPLADAYLHAIIDLLDPSLRTVERDHDGKQAREREFYRMQPEEAYALLSHVAELTGTVDRLHLYEPPKTKDANGKAAFRFSDYGLSAGDEIVLDGPDEIVATVLDDAYVVCEDLDGELKAGTPAEFARMHLGLATLPRQDGPWWDHGRKRSEMQGAAACGGN